MVVCCLRAGGGCIKKDRRPVFGGGCLSAQGFTQGRIDMICLCRDVRIPLRAKAASWLWRHEFQVGCPVLSADVEDALLAFAATEPVGQHLLVVAFGSEPVACGDGARRARQADVLVGRLLHERPVGRAVAHKAVDATAVERGLDDAAVEVGIVDLLVVVVVEPFHGRRGQAVEVEHLVGALCALGRVGRRHVEQAGEAVAVDESAVGRVGHGEHERVAQACAAKHVFELPEALHHVARALIYLRHVGQRLVVEGVGARVVKGGALAAVVRHEVGVGKLARLQGDELLAQGIGDVVHLHVHGIHDVGVDVGRGASAERRQAPPHDEGLVEEHHAAVLLKHHGDGGRDAHLVVAEEAGPQRHIAEAALPGLLVGRGKVDVVVAPQRVDGEPAGQVERLPRAVEAEQKGRFGEVVAKEQAVLLHGWRKLYEREVHRLLPEAERQGGRVAERNAGRLGLWRGCCLLCFRGGLAVAVQGQRVALG